MGSTSLRAGESASPRNAARPYPPESGTYPASDKPMNPPPCANQPPLGVGLPPEGMTAHDTPKLDKSKKQAPKAKAKKKPAKKKKKQS